MTHYHNPICTTCYTERVPLARAKLQADETPPRRPTCMTCGDKQARATTRTIANMHKSNYMLITDPDDLKGINNKGGLFK